MAPVQEPIFEQPFNQSKGRYSKDAKRFMASLEPNASVRAQHIRRLLDLMELSLQRRDHKRAYRCWAILVRCHEVDVVAVGWQSFARYFASATSTQAPSSVVKTIGVEALRERVLGQIANDNILAALDDLELYLPSFPHADDAELHIFAAMLSLQLAQAPVRASSESSSTSVFSSPARSRRRAMAALNLSRVAEARKYFRAALELYESQEQQSNAPGPTYCRGILSVLDEEQQSDSDSDVPAAAQPSVIPSSDEEETLPPAKRTR